MPSGKRKENFNDTWKEADLEKSLKGIKDESRRRHAEKERDDRKRDRHKTDDEKRHRTKAEGDDKRDRRHRDKENGDVRHKDKSRDDRHPRSKHEDRDSRSHRGKTDDRDRDERRHRSRHDDREGRHKSDRKDGRDEQRHRSKHEEQDDGRRKEGSERHRRQDDERDHRKHRNDDDVKKHRQSRDDEKHRRHREEDDRERRHRKSRDDKEGDRHRRDKDERRTRDEKHHRSNDEDDKERRKRHEEKKRKEEERRKPAEEDDKERKRRHEEKKRREEERKREEEKYLLGDFTEDKSYTEQKLSTATFLIDRSELGLPEECDRVKLETMKYTSATANCNVQKQNIQLESHCVDYLEECNYRQETCEMEYASRETIYSREELDYILETHPISKPREMKDSRAPATNAVEFDNQSDGCGGCDNEISKYHIVSNSDCNFTKHCMTDDDDNPQGKAKTQVDKSQKTHLEISNSREKASIGVNYKERRSAARSSGPEKSATKPLSVQSAASGQQRSSKVTVLPGNKDVKASVISAGRPSGPHRKSDVSHKNLHPQPRTSTPRTQKKPSISHKPNKHAEKASLSKRQGPSVNQNTRMRSNISRRTTPSTATKTSGRNVTTAPGESRAVQQTRKTSRLVTEQKTDRRDVHQGKRFAKESGCATGERKKHSSAMGSLTQFLSPTQGSTDQLWARAKKQLSEDEDDYDYDDDFEDYDDDFENDESDEDESEEEEREVKPLSASNKELDEIRKAMHEENERVLSGNRRTTTEKPEKLDSDRGSKQKRTFINFVSAKQRQISGKLASRTCHRGRELLQIIDLDKTSYEMFEMPPITEYKLYMRTYGRSDAKQAYVQTNDDNIDRELQTEAIESTEKWTQHPPEDVKGYGGAEDETGKDDEETKSVDTVKLNKFLQASGQVMLILLEEERASKSQSNVAKKQSNICVSEAFVDLTVPEMLQGRHVVHSQFSPSQSHLLLTAHSLPSQHSANKFSSSGVVCVWNANDPSRPQKILMCESQPRCCCFSPSKASLAFAGMNDGSVVLWDLRESRSLHRTYNGNDGQWLVRFPTYDTAGVLDYDNHHSPVVAIQPVTVLADSGDTSAAVAGFADTGDSLSFQLATLEENSVVHLWVVAEISNPDPSGSESDLGLLPGGRVKLIKSSSIPLESPLRNVRIQTTLQSLDMQLLPTNNSHFYVTTDTGCIIHGVRYGGKAPPRVYRPEFDILIKVTDIDFSPFTEPVFLTGCNDGSLRLYSIKSERPLLTWTDSTKGVGIRCVRWCRSRPAVFFLLDEASQLYIWDLLLDDSGPIKHETIAKSRVTNLGLSNDHTATGVGIQGRSPQMVVGLENGTIEIHTISKEFSALMLEEIDQFATYIQRLF